MEIIHADEVARIETGTRWFIWCYEKDGLDPVQMLKEGRIGVIYYGSGTPVIFPAPSIARLNANDADQVHRAARRLA